MRHWPCSSLPSSSSASRAASTLLRAPYQWQDGIEQAFEELLPWALFSLRLNNSLGQIAKLDETIRKIAPPLALRRLRSVLYCVWPRFLWLRHDAGAVTPLPDAQRLLK